jgi:hypothetical protein
MRRNMRHTLGVALFCATTGLGLAMIAVYSSCGGTGGGADPSKAALQVVNPSCSPAGPNQAGGNCLVLFAPNSVPADGSTISGFRATLFGGDGAPIPNVQICFRFEDAGVATITEPTDGCGLTDANGNVSGQFQSGGQDGSFQLIAESPPGFNLQARKTISFQTTFRPGQVPPGLPCSTSSDCTSSECSANASVCPSGPCCLAGQGDPCAPSGVQANCASSLTCFNGSCAAPTPVPGGAGQSCTNASDCTGSLCCCSTSSGNTCQDSSGCAAGGNSCIS